MEDKGGRGEWNLGKIKKTMLEETIEKMTVNLPMNGKPRKDIDGFICQMYFSK